MPPVRVLVVDDNLLFLQAEIDLLTEEFDVVGSVSNGHSVLSAASELNPDVIVLDVSLGDMTGFEVARRLKSAGTTARIIFLTIHEGKEFVEAAMKLGAAAYVVKSQAAHDLPKAIVAAHQGKTYYPPAAGRRGN